MYNYKCLRGIHNNETELNNKPRTMKYYLTESQAGVRKKMVVGVSSNLLITIISLSLLKPTKTQFINMQIMYNKLDLHFSVLILCYVVKNFKLQVMRSELKEWLIKF